MDPYKICFIRILIKIHLKLISKRAILNNNIYIYIPGSSNGCPIDYPTLLDWTSVGHPLDPDIYIYINELYIIILLQYYYTVATVQLCAVLRKIRFLAASFACSLLHPIKTHANICRPMRPMGQDPEKLLAVSKSYTFLHCPMQTSKPAKSIDSLDVNGDTLPTQHL